MNNRRQFFQVLGVQKIGGKNQFDIWRCVQAIVQRGAVRFSKALMAKKLKLN
jgi:hypothetical protein